MYFLATHCKRQPLNQTSKYLLTALTAHPASHFPYKSVYKELNEELAYMEDYLDTLFDPRRDLEFRHFD